MKYRSMFAHGIAAGVGALMGSVVMYFTGMIDKKESLLYWAVGTSLIIASGIFYLVTRDRWDNGL